VNGAVNPTKNTTTNHLTYAPNVYGKHPNQIPKMEGEKVKKKWIRIDLETWYMLRGLMKEHHHLFDENDAILFLLRLQGYSIPERIPYPKLVYLPLKEKYVEP
jgi:hypothetical protein